MIRVFSVPPERRRQALALLFADCADEDREKRVGEALQAAEYGEVSLDGLLIAERDGEPAGAGLTVIQRDGTAFVWPPVVSESPDREPVADAIVGAVWREITRQGAWIGQCLLEPDNDRDRRVLSRNGFAYLLDLLFLRRLLSEPLPPQAPSMLETIPYDPEADQDHYARLLERTYIGSQDSPELNGVRTGEEALETHRTSGHFNASLWRRYCSGGRDVGVLLMSEHPDLGAWEITYLGVVPGARGRGYGRAMLLDGLRDARSAGVDSVLVSVDTRNTHALRIYFAVGFFQVAWRAVHARFNCGTG